MSSAKNIGYPLGVRYFFFTAEEKGFERALRKPSGGRFLARRADEAMTLHTPQSARRTRMQYKTYLSSAKNIGCPLGVRYFFFTAEEKGFERALRKPSGGRFLARRADEAMTLHTPQSARPTRQQFKTYLSSAEPEKLGNGLYKPFSGGSIPNSV